MASRASEVVVRITGEIRGFKDKLNEAAKDTENFGKRARSLFAKSFTDITSIVTSRFGRVGAEAQKSLDGMAARAATTGSGIGIALGAGALAAGAAVVELGRKGIAAFGGLASEIRSVERVSGANAETASRLTGEFRALGIDITAGARSFFMLSKNIEANKDKLSALGVQVARNRDGTVDLYGTLLNVRGAYQGTTDAQQRNVIASTALGRSGLALLPILAATSERLNEIDKAAQQHHEWMTQDQIDKAKAMNIATTEAGHAVEGLAIEVGEGLAPVMVGLAKDIEIAITAVDHFAHGVMTLLHHIPGVNRLLNRLDNNISSMGSQASDATGGVDDLSGSLDDQATAAEDAANALGAYSKELAGITDAALGIPTAMDDVNKAFLDLEGNAEQSTSKAAEAQSRLADAIESANRRIRDAEQNLADAQEDLNKQSSGDRTDARRRVRDAEEQLADARADSAKSIGDAKKNVDDLNPALGDSQRKSLDIKKNMEGVVSAVEKTVEEMIKQHTPASVILAYITSQRDRLGEIGTKLGVNKTQMQLYLDVLTQVYQTTKDIDDLMTQQAAAASGFRGPWSPEVLNGRPYTNQSGVPYTLSGAGATVMNVTVNTGYVDNPAELGRIVGRETAWNFRRRG